MLPFLTPRHAVRPVPAQASAMQPIVARLASGQPAVPIPVLLLDLNSFEDLYTATLTLGRLTGKDATAATLVSQWGDAG